MTGTNQGTDDRAALEYLKSVYALYVGHINSMLNFYLVVVGLAANALIQAYNPELKLSPAIQVGIAGIGLALSLIFFFLHVRCRQLLNAIEDSLEAEEHRLFPLGKGFLIHADYKAWGPVSHGVLVPLAYLSCIAGFALVLWLALQGQVTIPAPAPNH